MNEVLEKIIDRIEKRIECYKTIIKAMEDEGKTRSAEGAVEKIMGLESAKEIIEEETSQYIKNTNAREKGWIQCSESLPDVQEGTEDEDCPEFNVTIKGAKIATTLKCAPDGTWFDEYGNIYHVIAWQPLPEPYKKGE